MSRLMTLMVLALAPLSAFAQEADSSSRRVIYKDITEIDIEAVQVEGVLVGPQARLVAEKPHAGFPPMIKLRTDFSTEMAESVDQIR